MYKRTFVNGIFSSTKMNIFFIGSCFDFKLTSDSVLVSRFPNLKLRKISTIAQTEAALCGNILKFKTMFNKQPIRQL